MAVIASLNASTAKVYGWHRSRDDHLQIGDDHQLVISIAGNTV